MDMLNINGTTESFSNNEPSSPEPINSFENSEPASPAVIPVATIPDIPPTALKKVRFLIEDDGERPSTSKGVSASFTKIKITQDIGIYMDETSVMVGRFNSDINDVEILRHYSAEIAFVNGRVVIGLEAEKHRQSRNHFVIHNLLKLKASTAHMIELKTGRHSISTKSLYSSFFKQLGNEVMEVTQTVSLGNVCLTIPFTTTSVERSRLKNALTDAGFLKPRIISSLLSTAIAFTKDYNYYLNEVQETKLLFVAQCLKTSFSMAIIEISPKMLRTKSCFSSNNMPECRDGIFASLNEQLYNNNTLEDGRQEFVLKQYQKAVDQLYTNVSRDCKLSGIFVVKTSQKNTKLDCLFREIFGEDVTTAPDIARGPLLGASLLASKGKLSLPLIPINIQVYDSSRTNLIYSLNNRKNRIVTENQCFVPREVMRSEVVVSTDGATFTLSEEYSEDGFAMEVCRVSTYPPKHWRNKDFVVIMQLNIDDNGIYNVQVIPLHQFIRR